MCVGTITKTLKNTEGVESAKVDLESKIATVQFIPAKVDLASLEQRIAKVGYDANNTKRDPEAYENLDACCKEDGNH